MNKSIFIFQSIHWVIKAEKHLVKEKIEYKIIPVPKHISSECGMCIECQKENIEAIKSVLHSKNIIFTLQD
ncbi:MAG: DUF3343 domain-containing protein [Bacteroidota bacterium]|nr:DUF3343 domain-containing protein [Bacteroidota bacterium]